VRQSPASPGSIASMHDDTTNLVRQASLGKKMKASMTKIGGPSENVPAKKKEAIGLGTITAGVAGGALGSNREKPPIPVLKKIPSNDGTGNRTIIIDSSTSNSRTSSQYSGEESATLVEPIAPLRRTRSPLATPTDRSARQPASPLCGISRPLSKGPSMSDKVPSNRRPPHLDMDAVRDSEARGSVTSLPDLIRRATKLAANLDRGKTASRTGMLDLINYEKKEQKRRSGSISDILASFPPPSRGTPDGTRPSSRWPSPFSPSKLGHRMSYLTSHESGSTQMPRTQRRCCGMSLCTFVVIMILLAMLIAAAIVVPVVLIVLPRQRQNAANAAGKANLSHCSEVMPCQNGGASVVSGESCQCICVNGFTGDRCGTVADPGCTTTDVGTGSQKVPDATLGNAIPRLLDGASTNYSIPLNSSAILSIFSTSNLSCTSENALVTFNGQSMKARDVTQKPADDDLYPSPHSTSLHLPTPSPEDDLLPQFEPRQVQTSNGIVFQMPTATTAPTSSSRSSTKSATSSSPSSTSSSNPSSKGPTPETFDFARIAVLFVLEQTGQLNTAVKAQDEMRNFLLAGMSSNATMSLGSAGVDYNLNFANFSIALGNGTEIGGKGDGNGGIQSGNTRRSETLRLID
jgi:hypothetical protein